jgi:hypothetical protein
MSEIKVDTLTGKTTANDITVTVGATATMSLEQGLAKAWVNFNGTGTIAARDSLSVSGLVDNGTGNYTVTLTNAMVDTNQSTQATSHGGITNGYNYGAMNYLDSSGSIRMMTVAMSTAAASDRAVCNSIAHGDLA